MARTRTRVTSRNRTHSATRATRPAALALALVACVSACGASAGDDKEPETRSFGLHGRTLTVESDDSALDLVVSDSADSGEVRVTRWFQGHVTLGGDPEVTWAMKGGDRLVLRMKCSGVVADCSARHRIVVPRGVAVKVEDGDGSVSARGFEEALSIRTADGSVRVSDSSGALDLRSGDGSIRAVGVDARSVRARTDDGSVQLELGTVPDLVDSRSGDGSVSIVLPRATYRVTAGSGDGSVHVDVPRDGSSSHRVSAHTDDGKITVRTAN
ncbi:DUF4097 family beta strand repeat-containing protein [Streptomyces sp. NBC_00328]|uniref:DUF4097 family beta strand repeat-containing protein n=1 Tax=Streptomyces sp. NBC_00328 TaxID=2903646 RepID=UPI002E2BB178|nr:DUF4097 family beta strand repeat-containing protein [Streptomyces sp. NBC_00328]